jgi:ribosome modulation factor
MTPYEQGYEAREIGRGLNDNPYEMNTDEWDEWINGWYKADDLKDSDVD